MRRAIAISCAGLGTTSPNPPVGCVILDRDGRVVGEGYHQRAGEAHAEVNALTAAGGAARGGTAVVTLEPCNHHGRTPPCRQALIDGAVARVVIGIMDPTSTAQGGAEALRQAGVEVEQGVLAGEAMPALGPWLQAVREGRPVVTWGHRSPPDFTSDLPDAARLRAGFDAVLTARGRLEEGIPGGHGAETFRLPPVPLPAGLPAALAALYEGGVRTLLLEGGRAPAAPFLAPSWWTTSWCTWPRRRPPTVRIRSMAEMACFLQGSGSARSPGSTVRSGSTPREDRREGLRRHAPGRRPRRRRREPPNHCRRTREEVCVS